MPAKCAVLGCVKSVLARGLCGMHYERLRSRGSTDDPRRIEARFARNFHNGSGCWEWIGTAGKDGRGVIHYRGRQQLASRVSYQLHRGPIPDGLFVCHTCDNPRCVNPAHLWLGTATDNHRDMREKGRQSNKRCRGSEHGRALLSESQVKEIRSLRTSGMTLRIIGQRFGVSPQTVCAISKRRIWTHI